MFKIIDPRKLLVDDETLKQCQDRLAYFKANKARPEGVSDSDMWDAQETGRWWSG